MDRCPVELLHEICSLACADSGVTGQALSLVSKSIHNISAPTRLRSVALRSANQIISFSSFLKTKPNLHHRVHNLYLSVERSSSYIEQVTPNDGDGKNPVSPRMQDPQWKEKSAITTEAIHNILEMTSSRLETLTIILTSSSPEWSAFLVKIPGFPKDLSRLTDLTVYLPSSYFYLEHPPYDEHVINSDFFKRVSGARNLKRLHLAGDHLQLDNTAHSFPIQLSFTFPHLTHLRLSNLSTQGAEFLQDLFDFVRQGNKLPSSPSNYHALSALRLLCDSHQFGGRSLSPVSLWNRPSEDRFSTNIEKIIVLLCKPPRRCIMGSPDPHGEFRCQLKLLADSDRELGDEKFIHYERDYSIRQDEFDLQQYKMLYDWWTDRAGGGLGCWSDALASKTGSISPSTPPETS